MSDKAQSTSNAANFKLRYPDSTQPDAVAAARFLAEITNHGPMTIVAMPVGGASPRALTFDTSDPDAMNGMRSFIAFQETQPHNVFYVANDASLKCLYVPATEDIRWIRLVVLDFDPDKLKALEEERDRLRRVAHDLLTGPVQPRAIVDTGGGMQAVFQLLEPIAATPESIAEIELLMKSLARSLGADTATCTVKNLFRVPGTKNWPTAAKKAAGREISVGGIWHSGGPRTSLVDLRALATVQAEDAPASAPVEFDGLSEADVTAVLADPSALPAAILDLLRDPILQKAIQRPVNPSDTSGDDFYLACTLSRCKLPPHDIALLLSAYGHKVQAAFAQERLFSYVVGTVEKAVARIRVEALLDDFEGEANAEEAETRKKEHRARLKPLSVTEALEGLGAAEHDYLIQGFMRRGELMVLYGRPGSGKTFVALDLGYTIAQGLEWNERRVKASAVIYIAAESPLGVRYRLKALADRYGPSDKFFLIGTSVNMFDPLIDLGPLMREIKNLGTEIGLIVIDTLARTMIGGNENSTQDMSRLIANGDILRDRFGCAVAWVHHTGKNEAAGARGSSALVAATDTEIEISGYTFRSTKMRDREDIDYAFRLQQVPVITTSEGEVVTSCIVNWVKGSGAYGQNTPESNNLAMIIGLLRIRGEMMTLQEIRSEAELTGRKFTVTQKSLAQALNRACESETNRIFTRELSEEKAGKSRNLLYRYGLVNW
jgi:hypothetical protein